MHGAVDGSSPGEWTDPTAGNRDSDPMFALAPDVVAVVGFDGLIRRVNATATAVSGYGAAELVGRGFRAFIHPDDLSLVDGAMAHLAFHGTGAPSEARLITRDGTALWYEWHSVRIGPEEFVTFGRDISARKRAELILTMADQAMGDLAQGYWVHETAGDTLYLSAECSRLLGYEPRAAATTFEEFLAHVHPEDREPRLRNEILATHRNPVSPQHTLQYRLVRADGSVRHCLASARLRRDAEGRVVQAVGTLRDITESLELQTQLRVEQEIGNAVFASTGAFIIVLDRHGALVRFNPAAERATGWSCDDLKRAGWERLFPEDERDGARKRFEAICAGTCPDSFNGVWITRGGRTLPIAWSHTVTRDEQGEVRHVIATGIDISGLQQTHEQLRTARKAYRGLLESTCDMVLTQTPDGTILDINSAGARMLGAEGPEEIAGLHLRDIIHPGDLQKALDGLAKTLEAGERRIGIESRHLTRDGRTIDVEVIASAATSWHGLPALQTVFRDLTDRRNAERAMRQREHHMATLARAAPVGIFETDRDGRCTCANERYLGITGYDEAETAGEGWWDHVVPEDLPRVRAGWQRMVAGQEGFRMEYRLRRKDGAVIWVLGQAAPEPGGAGGPLGYVGSITDINKSKLDEIELRNYREHLEEMVRERTIELEAVNRELESFSYSVSHDLRAPLRAISGFNAALLEQYAGGLDDDARFFLNRIDTNARRMSQLIDDMLQLSKVTQAELCRESVDLSRLAEEIVEGLRAAEPEREVEVTIAKRLSTFGDPHLLNILMQNLLGNAWKYTGRNRDKAHIEFGTVEAAGSRAFFVRDNGVGFDMSCVGHLFRAFQRLHDSSQFEGTGVGLATAHRVVARHGGRIWAEAEEGAGATFLFTLH